MLGRWIQSFGGNADEGPVDENQRLREISLEYSEEVLRESTEGFHQSRRLGSGNYGAVYRGTLPDGHDVAVKVIDIDADKESASGFSDEVRVLSKFRHPNLVILMGWGTGPADEGKCRRFLVYELLSGGDIAQRMAACRVEGGRPFLWNERLWAALDASCGLCHMHNSTPKAFHRDIKSANILLDRNGTAKMADFGLSGIAKHKEKLNMTCEQIAGTPGYACPHYIKSGRVTEETEVYAFGMVMMELLLNSMPACLGKGGNIVYPIFQVVLPTQPGALDRAIAAVDIRASWPETLVLDMATISLKCSDMNMSTRPTFTDVGRRLRQLCEEYCAGERGASSTDPKLNKALAPQSSVGGVRYYSNPAGAPTRPQIHSSITYPAGAEPPTRPQLHYADNVVDGSACKPPEMNPTQPELVQQVGCSAIEAPTRAHGGRGIGSDAPTRPQMGPCPGLDVPTRPQMGRGPGLDLPTRPQMVPGPGLDVPTWPQMGQIPIVGAQMVQAPIVGTMRPQMGQLPSAGAPTRPQIGHVPGLGIPTRPQIRHLPGSTPDIAPPTRPQMGSTKGVEVPTRPQIGIDAPSSYSNAGTQISPPTQPQMPDAGYRSRQTSSSRAHMGDGSVGRKFDDAVRSLYRSGWGLAVEGQNVIPATGSQPCPTKQATCILECTFAQGLDLRTMPLELRCLLMQSSNQFWNIGRQMQPQFFGRMVLDDAVRCSISRVHLEIANSPGGGLHAKRLSPNAVLIDGMSAPLHQAVRLAQGSCIGFCGSDNNTTFLEFAVLVPEPSEEKTRGKDSFELAPVPGGWWFTGDVQYALVCTMAFSCDVLKLPREARTAGLRVDSKVTIGRLHQPGFFEGVLGEEPGARYLCCVSRAHLEVRPSPSRPGHFEVMNLSANPVCMINQAPSKLGKGDSQIATVGDSIEFIGNSVDGNGTSVAYLRLELTGDAPSRNYTTASVPTKLVVDEPAEETPLTPRSRKGSMSSVGGPQQDLPVRQLPQSPRSQSTSDDAFWLVLGGSAVQQEFPEEQRCLCGSWAGLTIGRQHQKSLHANAFSPELTQFLSREHFRIEPGREASRFYLVPLSSNPMWHRPGGSLREVEVGRGDEPLKLSDGDEIYLFTGADDCTIDGPGHLGILRWLFRQTLVDSGSRGGRFNQSGCAAHTDSAQASIRGWAERNDQRDRGPVTPRRASGRSVSPRRAHFGDSTEFSGDQPRRW